eukprot:2450948-Ditylum_brightwellii.AAC.1
MVIPFGKHLFDKTTCLMYHMKSCPHERLTLVLVHGGRSLSLTIVQLAIVARCMSVPSKEAQ